MFKRRFLGATLANLRTAAGAPVHRIRGQVRRATTPGAQPSKDKHAYTHGHAPAVVANHAARTCEEFAPHLVKVLRFGDSILDVGCGPGSITAGFRKYVGPRARIVGIDVESKVLNDARAIVGSNAEIMQGDVYKLAFPDNSFDVVHAHQVLQHLKDPIAALREMKRVSKGIVTCRDVDFESWLHFPADDTLKEWRDVFRAVCRKNLGQPDGGRYLKHWFVEAGFDVDKLQVLPSVVSYTTPERCKFIGESWAKRITETPLGKQMVDYQLATPARVQDYANAWLKWSSHPTAVFNYVDIAVIAKKD